MRHGSSGRATVPFRLVPSRARLATLALLGARARGSRWLVRLLELWLLERRRHPVARRDSLRGCRLRCACTWAVSLIGLLSLGVYLSPAMDLECGTSPAWLLGAHGWCWSRSAWRPATRRARAALLLIALGPLGMIEFGIEPVLQRYRHAGPRRLRAAAPVPGRWSADHEQGERAASRRSPTSARCDHALQVGVSALALIFVAVYEKVANPGLALAFLADHPHFNVAQEPIGLQLDRRQVHARGRRHRGAVRPADHLRRDAAGVRSS